MLTRRVAPAIAPWLLMGLFTGLFAGCAGIASKEARAQDAAQELNLNARFGRTQLVTERLGPKERADYMRTHKAWGTGVRVTDAELDGFHITSDSEAEVNVKVAWYRPGEEELRTTVLRQKWRDHKGAWLLVGEERVDGDMGLLGDRVEFQVADTPRPPAMFPTVRLPE